jgi:NAD-dependent dihydropyrimidine dehydrogenase PreA subunit
MVPVIDPMRREAAAPCVLVCPYDVLAIKTPKAQPIAMGRYFRLPLVEYLLSADGVPENGHPQVAEGGSKWAMADGTRDLIQTPKPCLESCATNSVRVRAIPFWQLITGLPAIGSSL